MFYTYTHKKRLVGKKSDSNLMFSNLFHLHKHNMSQGPLTSAITEMRNWATKVESVVVPELTVICEWKSVFWDEEPTSMCRLFRKLC